MNSTLDVIFIGVDDTTSLRACGKILLKSVRLEKILSCHDPEAETFKINTSAFNTWTKVSDKLWCILHECVHYNKITNGYFDIGLGKFKLPQYRNFIMNGAIHGIRSVAFHKKKKAVKFLTKMTSLDFGAIGKGLLLKEIDQILTDYKIENCLISFGGSSILARGSHPNGKSWPISMRESLRNTDIYHLENEFASISGSIQDNQLEHIINPRNLKTEKNNRLSFVQSKSPILTEILSTSLIVAKEEDYEKLISEIKPFKVSVYSKNGHNEIEKNYKFEYDE